MGPRYCTPPPLLRRGAIKSSVTLTYGISSLSGFDINMRRRKRTDSQPELTRADQPLMISINRRVVGCILDFGPIRGDGGERVGRREENPCPLDTHHSPSNCVLLWRVLRSNHNCQHSGSIRVWVVFN